MILLNISVIRWQILTIIYEIIYLVIRYYTHTHTHTRARARKMVLICQYIIADIYYNTFLFSNFSKHFQSTKNL